MDESRAATVLIANYNHGSFLREAVESALNQTYPNVQVLIVDDGSTDGSREVLAAYGSRVDVLFKENGGQASAFNVGIAHARGEYICFLDSDDRMSPERVALVVAEFERSGAALVYNRFGFIGSEVPTGEHPRRLVVGDLGSRIVRSGGWWPFPPTSALAVRTSVLREIGLIPEEPFRICADAYVAGVAPLFGRVAAVPESLTTYRLHESNGWTTSAQLRGHRDELAKSVKQYEIRVDALNGLLETTGRGMTARLESHWPWVRGKWLLGERPCSFARMVWLGLTYEGQPARIPRIRAVVTTLLALLRQRLQGGA